jgi:predicted aspartyl protease
LEGNQFIVPIKLRKNGKIIKVQALMDTGAQAWLLADQKLCEYFIKR